MPPYLDLFSKLLKFKILEAGLGVYTYFFGVVLYTTLVFLSIAIAYIRTQDLTIAMFITTVLWTVIGMVFIPEISVLVYVLWALSLTSLLYKLARS